MYLRCNTQVVSFLSDSKYIKRFTRKWWSMENKHWRWIVIAQDKPFHAIGVCLGPNLLTYCLWQSCNWRWGFFFNKNGELVKWWKREFHISKLNVEMHHWAAVICYLICSSPHNHKSSHIKLMTAKCVKQETTNAFESSNQQDDATWISHKHTFCITGKPIHAADSYHVNLLFSYF